MLTIPDPPTRQCALFIPYKKEGNEILVYLQKRSVDAVRLPGFFGFFGGGIEEGETPEQGLIREIKEELNFTPEDYRYMDKHEFPRQKGGTAVKFIFYQEVSTDFESQITVLEGDYGQWFSLSEIEKEEKVIEEDRIVLRDFYKKCF